jgi:hypothetical protein
MNPAPPVTNTFIASTDQLGITPDDLHRIAAPGKYNVSMPGTVLTCR